MTQNRAVPSQKLVREMDVAAPRYTSYPTIPVWKPAEGDQHARSMLARGRDGKPVSIYLHVPFCEKICSYCGCNTKLLKNQQQVCTYADALEREIALVRSLMPAAGQVEQIHWGGGTPSVLPADRFNRALSALHTAFDIAPDAECAIETNPMTCDDEKLQFLLSAGFNRFSIGIQDFDPVVQENIGRHQSFERTAEFVGMIRTGRNVQSVNFDLVYGLPGQRSEGLADTLDRVVELAPDRVAVYSFAFLPRLRENQQAIDAEKVPAADRKFELYLTVINKLEEAGYRMIGMDHFALPDDELAAAHAEQRLRRNFMGYTTRPETDMLAFGATAIADLGEYYSQNIKGTTPYMEQVNSGSLPTQREMLLDDDDMIRRQTIMDLLCNGVVDLGRIGRRFDIDAGEYFREELGRLKPLEDKGLVELDDAAVRATRLGVFFLRNLALHFDNYLDGRKGDGSRQTFSRTV